MKLAIIGGGPRALFALEELAQVVAETNLNATIEVTVFEPGTPGAGWVYREEQSAHWRLNAPSSIVRTTLGNAAEYLDTKEAFPPRRKVGQFLAASFEHLLANLPPQLRVRHSKQQVGTIVRGEQWRIEEELFDEVLLTTGHQHHWAGELRHALHPYFDSLDSIPADQPVHVRGAALTFIDVCLELSEGRGGRFEGEGLLEYHPSGKEPSAIIPMSRSGRFMEVKPAPDSALATQVLPDQEFLEGEIAAAPDIDTIKAILRRAAASLLPHPDDAAIDAVLEGRDDHGDAVEALRASCQVALGLKEPSPAWAVGHAWRTLYAALIARVSYSKPIEGFDALARTLERVAFGPPPITATRVLALCDAGIVRAPERQTCDEADIDAVIAPPGVHPDSLVSQLISHDVIGVDEQTKQLQLGRAGQSLLDPTVAVIGRDAASVVLGHDTLNRDLHPEIRNWAQAVAGRAFERNMHATVPLEARLEPWMLSLLSAPQKVQEIVDTYDSPTNVVCPDVLERNAAELVHAGTAHGVDVRVFFARKANKALAFVDAARDNGHGVDVASERELSQVLARGVPGERIILSAAVKPDRLLRLAIDNNVCISADSREEARRIEALANTTPVRIAPRIAPEPDVLMPTRFGERASLWIEEMQRGFASNVRIAGVHLHLHGYAEADRRKALSYAFQVIDAASGQPEFIDIGGGIPMSYLDHPEQWRELRERLGTPDFTWKHAPLANVYPFFQRPVRGQWLWELLDADVPGYGRTAEAFRSRGLRLHAEPGRSLLDGGGVILAKVAFIKQRSDGLDLVGLEMNRTQCRTTSDDILLDPILVPCAPTRANIGLEAFLVGAYCIEDEVIVRRKMRFEHGVSVGDVIAIPNTAGYFMHILESASHQIPLAMNVVYDPGTEEVRLDAIDAQ